MLSEPLRLRVLVACLHFQVIGVDSAFKMFLAN